MVLSEIPLRAFELGLELVDLGLPLLDIEAAARSRALNSCVIWASRVVDSLSCASIALTCAS